MATKKQKKHALDLFVDEVEAAAQALCEHDHGVKDWTELPEAHRQEARERVRVVVRALGRELT